MQTLSAVAPRKTTILYYMDGKNNLSNMAARSLASIARSGSDDNVNLVAQVGLKGQDVYRGLAGNGSKLMDVDNLGRLDMGNPVAVTDFVRWGLKKYPAEVTILVLWNHGAGFKGILTDDLTRSETSRADYKTQCGDSLLGKLKFYARVIKDTVKGSGHGSICNNRELAAQLEALEAETGIKIDVLSFNACLMKMGEVDFEFRNVARHVVGSQELEAGLNLPIPGLYGTTPQHKVIEDIKAAYRETGKPLNGEEVAKLFVYESKHQAMSGLFTPTQSASNTVHMEALHTACETLAERLVGLVENKPEEIEHLRTLIRGTQHYANIEAHLEPYVDFRDLGDFTHNLIKDEAYPASVRAAAKEVQVVLRKAVVATHRAPVNTMVGRSMEGSTGFSCYLPVDYGFDRATRNGVDGVVGGGTHGYEKTSWGEGSKWEKLLKTLARDDDQLGRWPELNRALVNLGQLTRVYGYAEALGAATGIESLTSWGMWPLQGFPWMIPLPATAVAAAGLVGGGLRIKAGIDNLSEAWRRDDSPNRLSLAVNGAIDVAVGTGIGITCAAAAAGAAPAVQGVATATLLLAGGRMAYKVARHYQKQQEIQKLTVAEKLARADQELKPNLTE